MGCSHSTPPPTEEDWTFVHGPPGPFLCVPPKTRPSDTYDFSLLKNCWKKGTSVNVGENNQEIQIVPNNDDGNSAVLLLQTTSSRSTENENEESATTTTTIALLKLDANKLVVNVYSLQPATPQQTPSNSQQYQEEPLYHWATISKQKFSHQCNMTTITNYDNDVVNYTTDFYGSPLFGSRKLVVKREGLYCASLRRSTSTYAYKVKVAPGVDPLLVVCLVASMDKIHQCEQKSLEAKHYLTSYQPSAVM